MEWLPIIASVLLLGLGAVGLFAPNTIARLVCLEAYAPMGVTELRVIYGGIFLGAGASALYFREQPIFLTLGVALGLAAVVRAIAMVPDGSVSAKNVGSVAGEAVLAVLFLAVLL